MTKSLLFIASHAPHGLSAAREGLDAVLASSAITEHIALLFVGDGVWQLKKGQSPEAILQRHLLPTFGMLALYDVEQVYVCTESLELRGLDLSDLAIEVKGLSRAQQLRLMADSHAVLRF
jgi:tRNA 2-thiouridine synthesizing protein C